MSRWKQMTTAERVAAVRALSERGLSARQIGEKLGTSRCAIIGIWTRNPDIPRDSVPGGRGRKPAKAKPEPVEAVRPKPAHNGVSNTRRKRVPDRFARIITAPDTEPVSIIDARHRQCRYVVSEGVVPALVCGAPTDVGSAWCPWHARFVLGMPEEAA